MLQILALSQNKAEIQSKVHAVIDKFAERGLRSLAVARQASPLIGFLFEEIFHRNKLNYSLMYSPGSS